jgi:NAD(P)-dependent dehydrogenase (short-subunit alcohol dehydrogenase family)
MKGEPRHVVVTGASRGIGAGIARAFAQAGDAVTLIADDEPVHTVAAAIARETGARVDGVRCDVTADADVAAAFADGRSIDVLVNNAGVELPTPLADSDPAVHADFERILAVNVTGAWRVTRAALPSLRRPGCILVTASIWGRTAVAGFSAYVASKHALIGLTRTWAHELAADGIRVNAVCPGWVRTEASMRSLRWMAAREGRPEAELLAEVEAGQVIGGLMEPADVAGMYVYLASPAAGSVTGQAIPVDRGEVMA